MGTLLKIGIILIIGFFVLMMLPSSCTEDLFGKKEVKKEKVDTSKDEEIAKLKREQEELQRKLNEANSRKPEVKKEAPKQHEFGGVRNNKLRVGGRMK